MARENISTLLVTCIMIIKPLHIMLPKLSPYVKSSNGQIKWMYFLIEDDELLEKCNTIWEKFRVNRKKEFESKPVYKKEF